VEAISAAEASIIRRAACLTVELERLELVFATTEAKPEDLDLYQRMSNTPPRNHRPQARAERRDADPVRILGFKRTCVKPTISIREALTDPSLLGNVLTGQSWQPWRVLLVAAMGEPLTDEERATFTALTGRPTEPLQRVEEFCAVVGRLGGKSRAMAILAAYVGGARTISCAARPASCS
jgi:hypothetical protein